MRTASAGWPLRRPGAWGRATLVVLALAATLGAAQSPPADGNGTNTTGANTTGNVTVVPAPLPVTDEIDARPPLSAMEALLAPMGMQRLGKPAALVASAATVAGGVLLAPMPLRAAQLRAAGEFVGCVLRHRAAEAPPPPPPRVPALPASTPVAPASAGNLTRGA